MTKEEAFKDWGVANMWNENTFKLFHDAELLHDEDKKLHPENHVRMPQKSTEKNLFENNCSCGFCYSFVMYDD